MSHLALALVTALLAPPPAPPRTAPPGAAAPKAARPAPAAAQAGLKLPDLRTLPAGQQARWPLVLQKCGRCHSMDVSLNQNYSPAEWRASLRRMVRLPGAGISQAQAAEILEFLRSYSTEAVRR